LVKWYIYTVSIEINSIIFIPIPNKKNYLGNQFNSIYYYYYYYYYNSDSFLKYILFINILKYIFLFFKIIFYMSTSKRYKNIKKLIYRKNNKI
jgi:hypothetical protein